MVISMSRVIGCVNGYINGQGDSFVSDVFVHATTQRGVVKDMGVHMEQ